MMFNFVNLFISCTIFVYFIPYCISYHIYYPLPGDCQKYAWVPRSDCTNMKEIICSGENICRRCNTTWGLRKTTWGMREKRIEFIVCNSLAYKCEPNEILKNISELPFKVEYLRIYLHPTDYEFTQAINSTVDLTLLSKLEHLKYFEITTGEDADFHFNNFVMNDMQNLTNIGSLAVFRVRVHIVDSPHSNLTRMIKHLKMLRFLDLSQTKGLAGETFKDILNIYNNSETLKILCLRHTQLLGINLYKGDISELMDPKKNLVLPALTDLDLSDNAITTLPPVLWRMFPNLRNLDVSGNLLLDSHNFAFQLQAFLHPALEIFNFNDQGYWDRKHYSIYEDRTASKYPLNYHTINTNIKMKEWIDDYLFIYTCISQISDLNISSLAKSPQKSCELLKCLFSNMFHLLNCSDCFESDCPISKINDILCIECALYITLPIGPNLHTLSYNSIHLEESHFRSIKLQGPLKLVANNSLRTLQFSDNSAWFNRSSVVFTDLINFHSLNRIDFSKNFVDLTYFNYMQSVLERVKYLDASNNLIAEGKFCNVFPNLEKLILKSSSLNRLDPNFITNCTRLNTIDLSENTDLGKNITTFDFLDLSGTNNLKHFYLNKSSIMTLNHLFLDRLKQIQNISIYLEGNPLSCNCSQESKNFIKRLMSSGMFPKYKEYTCNDSRGIVSLYTISQFKNDDYWNFCEDQTWKVVLVTFFSTFGGIMSVLMTGLVYYKRWKIKYILFHLHQSFKRYFSKTSTQNIVWKFDVYIAYATLDRNWVHEVLAKTLRSKYDFKVYIRFRDYIPGRMEVIREITDRMNESRVHILVLSEHSVVKPWWRYEMKLAMQRNDDAIDSLIVIKLYDIDNLYCDDAIFNMLQNYNVLYWEESFSNIGAVTNFDQVNYFWEKLVVTIYKFDPVNFKGILNHDRSTSISDVDEALLNGEDDYITSDQLEAGTTSSPQEQYNEMIELMQRVQEDNQETVPSWVYGPLPWKIQILLKEDLKVFDQLYNQYGRTKIATIIEYLEKHRNEHN